MNKIKVLRERKKMTQQQLADLLHVLQPAVAMWESGDNMPRADKLPQLAKILECTIDDLFCE